MSEAPKQPLRTIACTACGKDMAANRGVCPNCGAKTIWFKARLYLGCGFLLAGGLAILANLALALWGPLRDGQ